MKLYIYLVMFLLLTPIINAINFNDIISFERNNENNICDKGEFPIIDKDCELNFQDILNKVWFWKVLLILGVYYLVKKKDIIDKKIIIIILIIFLVMSIPVKPKEKLEGEIVKLNKTKEVNILEQTTIEKTLDWITHAGSKLSPEKPIAGWIFLLVILWILSGIFTTGEDIRDRFFDYKIRNFFRRKK